MIEFLDQIKDFEPIFFLVVGVFVALIITLIIKIADYFNILFLGVIFSFFTIFSFISCLYYLDYIKKESKEYCNYFPNSEICQELNKNGTFDKKFKLLSYKQMFEMLDKVKQQKQEIKNIKID